MLFLARLEIVPSARKGQESYHFKPFSVKLGRCPSFYRRNPHETNLDLHDFNRVPGHDPWARQRVGDIRHSALSAGGAAAFHHGLRWCGYGYGSGGQTAQGAALQGMSQVISAAGQYNLATSAAAINMTQAESNQLRNDVQGVQTFWQMRDIGRAERDKERGPRPTAEELARMARAAAPAA